MNLYYQLPRSQVNEVFHISLNKKLNRPCPDWGGVVPLYKLWARSIQPKFQPVRPGKEDHLKRWTRFFETFPLGPNRSIEFWTENCGKFGWMDRALLFIPWLPIFVILITWQGIWHPFRWGYQLSTRTRNCISPDLRQKFLYRSVCERVLISVQVS